VEVIRPILDITREFYRRTSQIHVVTTNWDCIARFFLKNSQYHFLDDADTVTGTQLYYNSDTDQHMPHLKGDPIYGNEKVRSIRTIMERANFRRRHIVSMGDSWSNDGPMWRAALENPQGVAVIVIHRETNDTRNWDELINKARERFKKEFPDLAERKDIGSRVIFIKADDTISLQTSLTDQELRTPHPA